MEQTALQGLVNMAEAYTEQSRPDSGGEGPTRGSGGAAAGAADVPRGRDGGHAQALNDVLRRTGRRVDETCAICLEELGTRDEDLSTLKCAHLYHTKCLERWMASDGQRGDTCPQCQGQIFHP